MYPDDTAAEIYAVTALLAGNDTNNLDEQDEEYAFWRDLGEDPLCERLGVPSHLQDRPTVDAAARGLTESS